MIIAVGCKSSIYNVNLLDKFPLTSLQFFAVVRVLSVGELSSVKEMSSEAVFISLSTSVNTDLLFIILISFYSSCIFLREKKTM